MINENIWHRPLRGRLRCPDNLASAPCPIILSIIAMKFNWPLDTQLWHTGWVAYRQFSSWYLQLDTCQTTPRLTLTRPNRCSPLRNPAPLTRAVNHGDAGALSPFHEPSSGWSQTTSCFCCYCRSAACEICWLRSTNTLCLPSGLPQRRCGWATWNNCSTTAEISLNVQLFYMFSNWEWKGRSDLKGMLI